jgi:PilZ domain
MVKEQRKLDRRNFSYYLPVADAQSAQPIGILTDISLGGFKLDSRQPIPNGQVNRLRLNLSSDFAPQSALVFAGRSKWCHPDHIDSSIYNVGFEVVNMLPEDKVIFQRVFERYGSQTNATGNNTDDFNYLWK